MIRDTSQQGKKLCALLMVAIFVILLAPLGGAYPLDLQELIFAKPQSQSFMIFWQLRLPRVLLAFFVGGLLSLSGMVFQAVFRNPLVSPFTLGVSAGASFGAAVYFFMGLSFSLLGFSGVMAFAFAGSLISILIVWILANTARQQTINHMLLAGVVVSFFFLSLILFIQYFSPHMDKVRISHWLMGRLVIFGYEPLYGLSLTFLISVLVVRMFADELNILATGEEMALSRGISVKKIVSILFFMVSLTVGHLVSICGPIAFIGIIVPHICRLMFGGNHRTLLWAVLLFGGTFLIVCDFIARVCIAPSEVPVGIITALIGGPFFLWLMRGQRIY
ncbi:MAG: iron ABC transporter permease [Candidatus Omnitrophica bacterium]|nr:iron ABC transporter permease [Candidatus Omnitrophota bacterium]